MEYYKLSYFSARWRCTATQSLNDKFKIRPGIKAIVEAPIQAAKTTRGEIRV